MAWVATPQAGEWAGSLLPTRHTTIHTTQPPNNPTTLHSSIQLVHELWKTEPSTNTSRRWCAGALVRWCAGGRHQITRRHHHLPQPVRMLEPDGPHGVEHAGPASACPRGSVNLSLYKNVPDRSLGRLTTNCLALATLGLGDCTDVTSSDLLLMARGLPRLATLSLRS